VKNKFTKGPWEAIQLGERSSWAIYQSGKSPFEEYSLAVLRSHESFGEPHLAIEEQAANAHLIAAAPELLAALEKISFVIKNSAIHEVSDLVPAMAKARDAIKKAKGENKND